MNPIRKATALVALCAGLAVSIPTAAIASDEVQTRDDEVTIVGSGGSAVIDVLANDTVPDTRTVSVTGIRVVSTDTTVTVDAWLHEAAVVPSDRTYSSLLAPDEPPSLDVVSSTTADGSVEVSFGAYNSSEPFWERTALLAYTLTDDLGATFEGALRVTEKPGVIDPVAVDDDLTDQVHMRTTGPFTSIPIHPWNDRYAEDVTRVEFGPLTGENFEDIAESEWHREGAFVRSDTHLASTTYRLCTASKCSDWATTTITWQGERRRVEIPTAGNSHEFYYGGPRSVVFDPVEDGRQAVEAFTGSTAPLDGLTPSAFRQTQCTLGGFTAAPDGTVTFSFDEEPPMPVGDAGLNVGFCGYETTWKDAAGEIRYYTLVSSVLFAPWQNFTPVDDVIWAGRGQSVRAPLLLNDLGLEPMRTYPNPDPGLAVDSDSADYLPRAMTSQFTLATDVAWEQEAQPVYSTPRFDPSITRLLDPQNRLTLKAGDRVGTETVPFRICPPYPTQVWCKESTVTLHVSPDVQAADDAAVSAPGQTVAIPVLDNDIYTDRLPLRDATVTLTDVPADVTARVLHDRRVEVTAPVAYAGRTVSLGYRLRDFTGASTATISVAVTTPDGDPDPVGPDAVDDLVEVAPGDVVTVPVLSNDVYGDRPVVALGDAPSGLTATLDSNSVEVIANKALAGTTVELPYGLTDASRLSDTAVVRVTVTALPPIEEPTPPDAVDDEIVLQPGAEPVALEILANDRFEGVPLLDLISDARLLGLNIALGDEGQVLISAERRLAGQTHSESYRLTDDSGLSDDAVIEITIAELPRVTPPDARDDRTEVMPGAPRTVAVLTNDRYSGDATVTTLGRLPRGLTVEVDARGRISVEAAESIAGQRVRFRYRLTDSATGLSDVATVTVEVGTSPIVVTGAERELPAAVDTGPLAEVGDAATSPDAVATGGLLALLGLALLLAGRRRQEVIR